MPNLHVGTQFFRFGLVGLINTLIDFSILNSLVFLFDGPRGLLLLGCNAVSFLGASLNSYFVNRTWTFSRKHTASLPEFGIFFSIALVGLFLNSAVLWMLTDGEPTSYWHLNLAKLAASVVSMGWNFVGYRVLFRNPRGVRSEE